MLRKKMALYAREIVEDGFCVNQNAVKINMEARNNYLFRKKRQGREADQVPLTVPEWRFGIICTIQKTAVAALLY